MSSSPKKLNITENTKVGMEFNPKQKLKITYTSNADMHIGIWKDGKELPSNINTKN